MNVVTKTVMAGAALVALAACGDGPIGKTWHQEAGGFLDEGGFGNPSMQNMMAQMCSGQAKGHIIADPIVAAAPNSTESKPVYRRGYVMCSGHLNGKYARVIWGDYIRSASSPASLGGGLATIDSGGG